MVRIAIYKSRNGQRTGRALYVTTRAARAGLLNVTLRSRSVLRKLRAGTYVIGMPVAMAASERCFGTGRSAVSADPPMVRKSTATTVCATPSAWATRWAQARSWRCR